MDNGDVQLVGGPCGQHGPYTFYKAFKYTKNGIKRIVTLSEFFFVKLWIDSDLLCIGELQLLWSDKNSEQVLASLRLYFLPENTPEGRMDHGEDEVLAISEKVVLRVEDLITWITVDAEWTWGRLAKCEKDVKEPVGDEMKPPMGGGSLYTSSLDFSDVEKERKLLDSPEQEGPLVIILSYPRYCRYRAMMRRLEGVENEYLKYKVINALGGFTVPNKNTRVLFCKETFDYPELEGHELLCNHLAPKLKGRPRGKRKKRSVSPGSESNESESSVSNVFNTRQKDSIRESVRNGLRCNNLRRSTRTSENNESKEFLKELSIFMKTNYTPIGRIPSLGYKELDLYSFYTKVEKLGGYDSVTANRLWKSIFDDMSGHQNSTSAATVIRRHYERFLLPYERHIKGEEYKPLPISERRRLKSKTGTSSASDAENSEGTSGSGNSTPIPQPPVTPTTPTTPTENKEFNIQVKNEGKTSSLRSVRVKPERQKDRQSVDKNDLIDISQSCNNNNTNSNNDTVSENEEKTESIKESINSNNQNNNNSNSNNNNSNNSNNKLNVTTAMIPDKDAEPVTSAVAPIAQKITPEKSLSPVEVKENIPIIKTEDIASASTPTTTTTPPPPPTATATTNIKMPEIIEVPYKPKSPEIIDLEAATTNYKTPPPPTYLHDVRKRKLDILKEGGLEVTPVRNFIAPPPLPLPLTLPLPPPPPPSPTLTKDIRPSVIQTTTQIGQKPIKNEIKHMPPPAINSVPPKRLTISIPTNLNISQIPQQSLSTTPPVNGFYHAPKNLFYSSATTAGGTTTSTTSNTGSGNGSRTMNSAINYPPKVVQSKSIYSYSEKMVYGNPKDWYPPPSPTSVAPKFAGYPQQAPRQNNGGNILDLSVTTPQKPVVEIVKLPPAVPLNFSAKTKSPPQQPQQKQKPQQQKQQPREPAVLDGRRWGSNLEITLVGPNKSAIYPSNGGQRYNIPPNPPQHLQQQRYPAQKRPMNNSDSYVSQKIAKLDHDSSKFTKPQPPSALPLQSIPSSHYIGRNVLTTTTTTTTTAKEPIVKVPPKFPSLNHQPTLPFNYLSHLYDNKTMTTTQPPPYLSMLDPAYYTAMHRLYGHCMSTPPPPILPLPPTEQLKFYTDLMAHNRINFPFPIPQNGDPSNTFKKP